MAGTISKDEINKSVVRLFELIPQMHDNFSIINDVSALNSITTEQTTTLLKVNEKIIQLYKLNKIIRIVGKSKTVLLQLSAADKKAGIKNIYYVPTIKEAISLCG